MKSPKQKSLGRLAFEAYRGDCTEYEWNNFRDKETWAKVARAVSTAVRARQKRKTFPKFLKKVKEDVKRGKLDWMKTEPRDIRNTDEAPRTTVKQRRNKRKK